MSLIDVQLEELKREYPEASAEPRGDGTTVVTVPGVSLSGGWNQEQVTVQFIAPAGFPLAQPDCFWADASLRLANGGMPKSSGVQTPGFTTGSRLWFSWHVSQWNGSRDTLRSFLGVIMNRLSHAE